MTVFITTLNLELGSDPQHLTLYDQNGVALLPDDIQLLGLNDSVSVVADGTGYFFTPNHIMTNLSVLVRRVGDWKTVMTLIVNVTDPTTAIQASSP